jgi:transcriptional regulator with XRE-family HTH domain
VINVLQIKAARALLGWTAVQLAEKAGMSSATVKKYELQRGIPIASTRLLMQLKTAFENAGIEFTGDPMVNPGVTLHIPRSLK